MNKAHIFSKQLIVKQFTHTR